VTDTENDGIDHTVHLSDQEVEILRYLLERSLHRVPAAEQDELLGLHDKIPESDSTITQDAIRRRFSDV